MTFYAVELDLCPAFGWQGGPEFVTRVRELRNRHERRNANAALVRHRYLLPFQNITDADYLTELKNAHLAMRGQTHSFLAKDHADYQAVTESLGVAPSGSAAVQLVKNYAFGAAGYARQITKPVAGAVVYQAGVAKPGTISTLTGLFTPTTAWTAGQAITWTGEFRVPVRFASDYLPMTIDDRFGSGGAFAMNGSVELTEVFGE